MKIYQISTLAALLIILSALPLQAEDGFTYWTHSTGTEFLYSDYLNLYDFSIIAAEGNMLGYTSSSEWTFNYRNRIDYHSTLGWLSYTGLGGRFQVNSVPHFIFGIKGALDNDRFFSVEDGWFDRFEVEEPFMRKSGRYGSDLDYGLKAYGDVLFKPADQITWGFWNLFVVAENELTSLTLLDADSQKEPFSEIQWDAPEGYLQVTPRLIYDLSGSYNRLVLEAYMDNRYYVLGSVDLGGTDYEYFWKAVISPQWIVSYYSDHLLINSYSAVSAEVVRTIPDPLFVVKSSPLFTWNYQPLQFGLGGGGYEFRDEIGIVFDNDEIFGLKYSGTNLSLAVAPRIFASYHISPFVSLGTEAVFRRGVNYATGSEAYLDERFATAYFQLERFASTYWRIFLRAGAEYVSYASTLNGSQAPPDEMILRVTLKLQR